MIHFVVHTFLFLFALGFTIFFMVPIALGVIKLALAAIWMAFVALRDVLKG